MRPRSALAAALAVALLTTAPAGAQDEEGARTEARPLVWLSIIGGAVFAVSYLSTIAVTAVLVADTGAPASNVGYVAIPLAGSWVCLAECAGGAGYEAPIISSGVAQALGVTAFVLGFLITREVRVAPVAVLPGAPGADGPGASIRARF